MKDEIGRETLGRLQGNAGAGDDMHLDFGQKGEAAEEGIGRGPENRDGSVAVPEMVPVIGGQEGDLQSLGRSSNRHPRQINISKGFGTAKYLELVAGNLRLG